MYQDFKEKYNKMVASCLTSICAIAMKGEKFESEKLETENFAFSNHYGIDYINAENEKSKDRFQKDCMINISSLRKGLNAIIEEYQKTKDSEVINFENVAIRNAIDTIIYAKGIGLEDLGLTFIDRPKTLHFITMNVKENYPLINLSTFENMIYNIDRIKKALAILESIESEPMNEYKFANEYYRLSELVYELKMFSKCWQLGNNFNDELLEKIREMNIANICASLR